MSNSLAFFSDSGLTTPMTQLFAVQTNDGAAAAVDAVAYLGSPASGTTFSAASDPGVDPILVSIANSLTGLQIPANSLRLATSNGGLAGATPGAALNVGTVINAGSGGAVAVHVRVDIAATAAGLYENLTLTTVSTIEEAA
jgi:hypothetical protein